MSKILFKYRKTIKKAEYVHADLEYHQEVIQDAKKEFRDAISKLIGKLPPKDRDSLKNNQIPPKTTPRIEATSQKAPPKNDCFELVVSSAKPSDKEKPIPLLKSKELKTLFHRIAEETHPDKVRANGFSEKEVSKRTRLFKQAKEAFNENNWYMLHSIAADLNLSLPAPSEQLIEWIEKDIRNVEEKIAIIKNLTAWHWYMGNKQAKKLALRHFFIMVHGFNHPELE